MEFEAVIGLEVHAQLKTESKIFCGCSTKFGDEPNRNICPVCTGQPGVLPVLNSRAVELIVRTGLALNCGIARYSMFARKHYFYPDLPKNYQISQYEEPVCQKGYLDINSEGGIKRIGITRIHLEEDAGKLLHMIGSRQLDSTYVDYNRTGIPLMEIVSEPDLRTPDECYDYLVKLKHILEYIGVSDCNMEEGKLRCDANISIRPKGSQKLGIKTELKNMNSFKAVREAVSYEIYRQMHGGDIKQETRLWNAELKATETMRSKEEAHDYRYFPEPDLVPLVLDERFISAFRSGLGELPEDKKRRYVTELKLSEYDAGVLTSSSEIAGYFERSLDLLKGDEFSNGEKAKMVSNYCTNEVLGRINKLNIGIKESPMTPENLADLCSRLLNGELSSKIAKNVIDEVFETGKTVSDIVSEKGLKQITDENLLGDAADEAIRSNRQAVSEYLEGKEKALGALVGFVMKKTQGKANPQAINRILKEKINGNKS